MLVSLTSRLPVEVKADYAPFLVKCVKSPDKLRSFFDQLFFSTVQDN